MLTFLNLPFLFFFVSQRQRYEEEVGSCSKEGRIHCKRVIRLHHIAKLTSVDLQKGSMRKKLCKQSSFRAFSSFKLSWATLCKYGLGRSGVTLLCLTWKFTLHRISPLSICLSSFFPDIYRFSFISESERDLERE